MISFTAAILCLSDRPWDVAALSAQDVIAGVDANNVFKSVPHVAQRVELRLRASKRYAIAYFATAHHPMAINGFVHSKVALVDHRTDVAPPTGVHVITRTRTGITFGWASLDVVSAHQRFESSITSVSPHLVGRLTDAGGKVDLASLAGVLDQTCADVASTADCVESHETRVVKSTISDPQHHITFGDLAAHARYAFRIRSLPEEGPPSAWSTPLLACVLLPPRPVEKLSVASIGPSSVTLTWSDPQTIAGEGMTYIVTFRSTEHLSQGQENATSNGAVTTYTAAPPVGHGGVKALGSRMPLRATPPPSARTDTSGASSTATSGAHCGELLSRDCVLDVTGLFPSTQYRMTVTPQNQIGEKCSATNATILVRTAGASQWKI